MLLEIQPGYSRTRPSRTLKRSFLTLRSSKGWSLRRLQANMRSFGVTSVQDMSAGTEIGVYQELARRGELKTRIYGCSPLADYKRWSRTGAHYAFGDAMLRIGCLKGYADGSLGST